MAPDKKSYVLSSMVALNCFHHIPSFHPFGHRRPLTSLFSEVIYFSEIEQKSYIQPLGRSWDMLVQVIAHPSSCSMTAEAHIGVLNACDAMRPLLTSGPLILQKQNYL